VPVARTAAGPAGQWRGADSNAHAKAVLRMWSFRALFARAVPATRERDFVRAAQVLGPPTIHHFSFIYPDLPGFTRIWLTQFRVLGSGFRVCGKF